MNILEELLALPEFPAMTAEQLKQYQKLSVKITTGGHEKIASQSEFLAALNEERDKGEEIFLDRAQLPAIMAHIKFNTHLMTLSDSIVSECRDEDGIVSPDAVLDTMIEIIREPYEKIEDKASFETHLNTIFNSIPNQGGQIGSLFMQIAMATTYIEKVKSEEDLKKIILAKNTDIINDEVTAKLNTIKKEVAVAKERAIKIHLQDKCLQCRTAYEDKLRSMVVEKYVKHAKKFGDIVEAKDVETWLKSLTSEQSEQKEEINPTLEKLSGKKEMKRVIEQYKTICKLQDKLEENVPTKDKINNFFKDYSKTYKKLDDSLGRRFFQSIKRVLNFVLLKKQDPIKKKLDESPGRSFVKGTAGFFKKQTKEQKKLQTESAKSNLTQTH